MTIQDRMLAIQELLGLTREKTSSAREKELLLDAIDSLWFVWRSGQGHALETYLEHSASEAPAWVIAAFETRQEAEAWLNAQPSPPHMAHVLIADQYHIVLRSPEADRCFLPPDPTLAHHIEALTRDGLPPAVAHFSTRDEARAWFARQPSPPVQSVIQIGGEHHLAVYYRNIDHRALFPFSLGKWLEKSAPPHG